MNGRWQSLLILLVAVPGLMTFSLSCPDQADDDDDTYGEDDDGGDDDGGDDDAGDDDGGDDDDTSSGPEPGDVVFAEVMQNPAASEDLDGEWFELLNHTTKNLDLQNCVIHDGQNDAHTIGELLIIGAEDRLVLGRNTNTTVNGDVPVDYEYNSVSLGNDEDALILTCAEQEIDRIEWDGGPDWPDPTGASMILDEAYVEDNHDGQYWCESTSVIPGGTDLGTPGMPNDDCEPVTDDDTGDDDDSTPGAAFTSPERGWRILFNQSGADDDKPIKGWRLKLPGRR
jgi:Lamin Tail Domain